MPWLSLTLLGGFRARLGSGRAVPIAIQKGQALLAYLAVRRGQPESREKLATLLWGDADDDQARHSFRQTLFALRRALPTGSPSCLVAEGETVRLNTEAVDVDVITFERLAVEATPQALERAADLYRGDLLEGFSVSVEPFDAWLRTERERLHERALHILMKLLGHQAGADDIERAIDTAIRVLALDPLQEAAHRALMGLFLRQGRRGSALHQYQICVELLQRELGIEPEPETNEVYRRILAGSEPGRSSARPPGRARPRREPLGRISSMPLIGRDAEMARLHEAIERARRGLGQVVTVLGEAGIGKTRLVEHVCSITGPCGVAVLLGRCYETEQVLAFSPWTQALRGPAVTPRALASLPATWRTELTRLLPDLRDQGWPAPEGATGYSRLFEAVAGLLEHLASRRPLVLIIEDLHRADEMSLRLLCFLGRRVAEWPVLLLATAREEEAGRGLELALDELRQDKLLVQISVAPLSAEDTMTLMRTLAGAGLKYAEVTPLADQVWRMSEGNPFVIVESVRMMQEMKRLGTPGPLVLPEKVREVVAGRLARLSGQSQHLVAVAAVIGREFEFGLLQRAASVTEEEAATGVEELVRHRILRGLERGFDFTHERVREVAYGQLLTPRRRILHGRVAEALERFYAGRLEPHFTALGHHCWESEAWAKAAAYLRRAGAQAYARSAHRAAVACFEQALRAVARLPPTREGIAEAVDLRFDIRRVLIYIAEWERCVKYLLEAEALAREIGDQRQLGFAASYLCSAYRTLGEYGPAVEAGDRALAIAITLGDPTLEVETHHHFGQLYVHLGEYIRARDRLTRTLAALEADRRREEAGEPPVYHRARRWLVGGVSRLVTVSVASHWLALCLAELGEFAEGIALGSDRVRETEGVEAPDALRATLAYLTLGTMLLSQGDFERAIANLERALAACRRGDLSSYTLGVLARLSYAYGLAGRIAQAQPLLEEASHASAVLEGQSGRARWYSCLGEVYLLAGLAERAMPLAHEALALAHGRGERGFEAWAHRLLAKIAGHRDPPAGLEAEEHYERALALGTERGMRPLAAHCHLDLGSLHRRAGNRTKAAAHLAVAASAYRELEMASWLERAEAELRA